MDSHFSHSDSFAGFFSTVPIKKFPTAAFKSPMTGMFLGAGLLLGLLFSQSLMTI
jgi:hypothetical protein